ncbi:hypothetical protein [Flagellimonas maritima]|uniref:hypothetical protein n=1 Tax=Flagellimonas maritima TaxID=1383885 RepID=UPI0019816F4F|nr:hypothetical protein [Allomuricauda aurantiaca]
MAYKAEVQFFGQPGGLMDQYTIAQRGLRYIDTKKGNTTSLIGNLGKLIVAASGISKKTLSVLKTRGNLLKILLTP